MLLDLSEKEVKGIGERRWLKKVRKKWAILLFGSFIILLACTIITDELTESEGIRILVISPFLALWVVAYIKFMFRMDKEGKLFLEEQK